MQGDCLLNVETLENIRKDAGQEHQLYRGGEAKSPPEQGSSVHRMFPDPAPFFWFMGNINDVQQTKGEGDKDQGGSAHECTFVTKC